MALAEPQIRRYARHVLLPDVGGTGQARLLAAVVHVDLAADAAAGIAALTYLAAAGVGTLLVAGAARPVTEGDVATGIALGRPDLGRPLLDALRDRLAALNPDVTVAAAGDAPPGAHRLALRPCADLRGDVSTALVEGGAAACALIRSIAVRPS